MMPFIFLWLWGSQAQQQHRLTKALRDYTAACDVQEQKLEMPLPTGARADYKWQGKVAAGLEKSVTEKVLL